ncbi:MAG: Uma2 family endonuclease [Methyloglobulus sp.]|nr:Uma2 family endonuclease [Methyloglobulus sp.]
MSAVLQKKRLTEQDYLTLEATSEIKNEFVDGDCYAMSGASEKHNLITGNIFLLLRQAMRSAGCRVFASDMKCRADQGRIYYYPDVMVVCEKADNAEFYKEQPCFIAEVQSPSTERVDRHEKWQTYSEIASLRYYLLADSQQKKVDYFQRDEIGAWQSGVLEPGQSLEITCGDYLAAITFEDIYEDVVFL